MAHASTVQVAHGSFGFAHAVEALVERFSKYRHFRKTLAELNSLSPREMADIGLIGQSPYAVAYEAIYGSKG